MKCFRAVLLAESKVASDRRLLPTDFAGRYLPNQVIGILDVEDCCMPEGKIVVTEKSLEALQLLKSQRLHAHVEEEPKGKQKKEKSKTGQGDQGGIYAQKGQVVKIVEGNEDGSREGEEQQDNEDGFQSDQRAHPQSECCYQKEESVFSGCHRRSWVVN